MASKEDARMAMAKAAMEGYDTGGGTASSKQKAFAKKSGTEGGASGSFFESADIMPGEGMSADEVRAELLKIHQDDVAGPAMILIGIATCVLLLICTLGSPWVGGTFVDSNGSYAKIQMSLWSFTGEFVCKADCDLPAPAAVVAPAAIAAPSDFWIFAPIQRHSLLQQRQLGVDVKNCAVMGASSLFCGSAALLLNGTFRYSNAKEASKEVSQEAFEAIQMYDRTRYIIFGCFAWVVKIMVSATIPMYWYLYTDPARKHRQRALGLFATAPFVGVVGLCVWYILNPGVKQVGYVLGGSEKHIEVEEMFTLGWCFILSALTLAVYKFLAIGLAIRLDKDDFRQRQFENLLYEKKTDERLAAAAAP